MRILVCGGCGFIGSHFVRQRVHAGDDVVVLDKLTYAGNTENLRDLPGLKIYAGSIEDRVIVHTLLKGVDAVVNFAAETHVDRSISDSEAFITTNVRGTHTLLEAVRQRGYIRFVQVSTDEVYGSIPLGFCDEQEPLNPSSPYSASKAGADLLVHSYHKTYDVDTVIVRGSNAYGPNQFPEKLIPLMTLKAMAGEMLPVYGNGCQQRQWLYVEDFARGVGVALDQGRRGEVYNCGGFLTPTNMEVVGWILQLCGAPGAEIMNGTDRPGHDYRYALDSRKLRSLDWSPEVQFKDGLERTVEWYRDNEWWWEPITLGAGPYIRERVGGAT